MGSISRYRPDRGGDAPDKSSWATGQVFEPDRPHNYLHVLGRRLKTKALGHRSEGSAEPDMPSKSVGGREPAGGFDSRLPPLPKGASNSGVPAAGERRPRGRPRSGPERPRPPHKSFGVSSARRRTSLPTDRRRTGQVFGRRPLEGEVGAAWSAPLDDRWRDLPSCWVPSPYTAAIVQASCPHSHMCSSCAASPACSRQ